MPEPLMIVASGDAGIGLVPESLSAENGNFWANKYSENDNLTNK
jgi:hypothetical protein